MENTTNTNGQVTESKVPNTPQTTTSNNTTPLDKPVATLNNTKIYKVSIDCAIRRKPNLTALPGQDPNERIYKIGASLDGRTKGNLKGITGDLEQLFMPEIIGISANDMAFRQGIEEYWSSIGKVVPADEPYLKDHEKGVKIRLEFNVLGQANKERFDATLKVEDKVALLNTLLVKKTTSLTATDVPSPYAKLDNDCISDYLLLNYALKYNKVANSFEDIDKSPKIDFYIFEKAVSIKQQLSNIELRQKAMQLYIALNNDSNKINAILLAFGDDPKNYDNEVDKLLKLDELYNRSMQDMKRFLDFAEDKTWETSYIINKAISMNRLKNPVNTTAIYYNDTLLGMTKQEAVLYLNNDEKGKTIKESLLQEIKI